MPGLGDVPVPGPGGGRRKRSGGPLPPDEGGVRHREGAERAHLGVGGQEDLGHHAGRDDAGSADSGHADGHGDVQAAGVHHGLPHEQGAPRPGLHAEAVRRGAGEVLRGPAGVCGLRGHEPERGASQRADASGAAAERDDAGLQPVQPDGAAASAGQGEGAGEHAGVHGGAGPDGAAAGLEAFETDDPHRLRLPGRSGNGRLDTFRT